MNINGRLCQCNDFTNSLYRKSLFNSIVNIIVLLLILRFFTHIGIIRYLSLLELTLFVRKNHEYLICIHMASYYDATYIYSQVPKYVKNYY